MKLPDPSDTPLEPEKETQRSSRAAPGRGAGGGPLSTADESAGGQPLLETVLANAPIVLWAVDADGLFTLSTGQGLSVLGLKPGEVLGRSVFDLYQEHPKILADVRRAFTGEEFRSTVEVDRLYFDSWYSPIRNNRGVVVGVRGVATVITKQVWAETALRESEERIADVTEQKRVEEEARRRQQELAHVGRLNVMGEMAAALAHQLNQPLSAIANYAAGCARRLQSGHVEKEEMNKAAHEIGRQADRAGDTIRRILDFVRKRDVLIRRVDPQELTSAAVELVLPEARRQGVRIIVETSGSLPDIIGDQIQLEQVLLNLLVNAVEAVRETSADRRLVVVRTSATADGSVQVSVCDRGCGLPDDFEDWIFEPFQTTKLRGTGIGLSISRSIVQAHHGRLWAIPNEKQGATFYASFPLWPEGDSNGR